MKKIFVIFLIIIIFLIGNTYVMSKKNNYIKEFKDEEIRGVYISYLEYLSYFNSALLLGAF